MSWRDSASHQVRSSVNIADDSIGGGGGSICQGNKGTTIETTSIYGLMK